MQTIPRKFVANIREHLSEEVKLEAPDGKTYTVQVARDIMNWSFGLDGQILPVLMNFN